MYTFYYVLFVLLISACQEVSDQSNRIDDEDLVTLDPDSHQEKPMDMSVEQWSDQSYVSADASIEMSVITEMSILDMNIVTDALPVAEDLFILDPNHDPWLAEEELLSRQGQIQLVADHQILGDADQGWNYLLYGDYLAGGIPVDIFNQFFPSSTGSNQLQREGDNADIPRAFTAFDTDFGVRVIGGVNCFGCHSSYLNHEFIVGLGNSFSRYENNRDVHALLTTLIENQYGSDSAESKAYLEFGRGSSQVAAYALTPFAGINPAFKIEEAAVARRHPLTFEWQAQEIFTPNPQSLASDVPPWWHIRKKAALYYNGMGRGSMSKMLMQISVVAIRDRAQAEQIHQHFPDVLAWLYQMQAPQYPEDIDVRLAQEGEVIFNQECSRCHGTYHPDETQESYPNLLISIDVVGTDPHYALQMNQNPSLSRWINQGWYAQSLPPNQARMQAFPLLGYIAPPLDGIWATAPYLHNGSIPTLTALLDSRQRPQLWLRDYQSSVYDLQQVGWPYQSFDMIDNLPNDETNIYDLYDCRITGYGNQGHTFADHLDETQRTALLEYLKTL